MLRRVIALPSYSGVAATAAVCGVALSCVRSSGCASTPTSEAALSDHQQQFLRNFRAKLSDAEQKADEAASVEKFMVDAALEEGTIGLPCAPGAAAAIAQAKLLREAGPTSFPTTAAASAADSPTKAAGTVIEVPMVQRGQEPLPKWLRLSRPQGEAQGRFNKLRRSMREKKLSTVCEEARCPNIGECWGGTEEGSKDARLHVPTATIMIMGDTCTRACRFCAIKTARIPPPLDPLEPEKTAKAVSEMGVPYIVITMVDRDDLPDGGASHVVRTIQQVKAETKGSVLLECLVGDFQGNTACVESIANAGLEVYAHNVECVERVTSKVRDRRAAYRQSLAVLEHAKKSNSKILTKTSVMLGVGETTDEIRQTMRDLRNSGVDAVTFGQYLQPSKTRMKVDRYVHPSEFDMWKKEADEMGFVYCASGPMVRSSYRAGEFFMAHIIRERRNGNAVSADAAAVAAAHAAH